MVRENIEIRREFWSYCGNAKELFERVQQVIKIIEPNREYFTYNYLEKLLRKNRLSEGYSKYIYLYLMAMKEKEVNCNNE